eukprot:CAMPEP_0194136608 /NCGR_PEP_ID=MMETSP0152-20130528/6618_1 /TAXON_ID=1049557 /ORGANISM="Thalassiothrix antarctica, Strain L6-D1" /LENGTH=1170 /DNA_ID=CAMNT_0038833343 /DNA_START=378 /DNA_END=3890 /DNA_ORIENTATION=-
MAELDVKRFWTRLEKIYAHFTKYRSTPAWSDACCLNLTRGQLDEDNTYLKSTILHQYLFGYEIPDLIMILLPGGDESSNNNSDNSNNSSLQLHIMGTKKKIAFLQPASDYIEKQKGSNHVIQYYIRNKADSNQENYTTLLNVILSQRKEKKDDDIKEDEKKTENGDDNNDDAKSKVNKIIVGTLMKEIDTEINTTPPNSLVAVWESDQYFRKEENSISLVDCAHGLSHVWSVKDETELDLLKKSSVLSNKLMKHGCIPKLEGIINEDQSIKHEDLAQALDTMIEDPSAINLKIPQEDVASCYFPICQSGGTYDFRVSATSNSQKLKYDIIVLSLGARYQYYCSNITRTFLVDPPKAVSNNYELLLAMQDECRKAMRPGKPLKTVYKTAQKYLERQKRDDLLDKLPKNLGFAMGLEFRDSNLTLTAKNPTPFKVGMVFTLSCVLQNLELTAPQKLRIPKDSAVRQIDTYGLQIADMITIGDGGGEILTKLRKQVTDISYTINDEEDEDEIQADAALARKLAQEPDSNRALSSNTRSGVRASSRLAKHTDPKDINDGAAMREKKQISLMKRRNEERLQELARKSNASGSNNENDKPEELVTYRSSKHYPDHVSVPNQVKVDMEKQCVILPICGNPVPFHISTIKNVVLPDPDNRASYLRINFYTAGMAVGKDAPVNTAKLVAKYAPYATFIREMTFRSLDPHTLTSAYRQITNLRKKMRLRELREQEEANLVQQERLVRTKNERVPRLSDLTMRPVFAGRKTQGNLEAHSNGLRFISTRSEIVDVMYNNIKYSIFQPCENEIMVLIHFHLKNPIMVGKKRQKDVQFFTEVVDASQTVDNNKRSMYDPDEMDDEQRERQLRKKLNAAFRDFCKKVDAVAKKNGYPDIEFDVPYRDLGFTGNPHKEMVFVQPTLNCLVNLTETPFFVVDLADIDHVHFERVTYMSKAFDIVLVRKDFTKPVQRIDMIDNSDRDAIQDWLTDMEITYTAGPMNLNWKQIIQTVAQDERFYMDTEEDEVTAKEAGWDFLRMYGHEDDEDVDEDEDDSGYSDPGAVAGEEDDDDAEATSESEEEDFDSDEDESDEYGDADEELEEQGMDWEDMERQAMRDDRATRRPDSQQNVEDDMYRKRRRGGSAPAPAPQKRQRANVQKARAQHQQQQQRKIARGGPAGRRNRR